MKKRRMIAAVMIRDLFFVNVIYASSIYKNSRAITRFQHLPRTTQLAL